MVIAVTGCQGMLGREVMRALADTPHLAAQGFTHEALDITDPDAVKASLRAYAPTVVINCAGLTKHRDPLLPHAEMRRVNSLGPLLLARACEAVGARLIHVSTDCVFTGDRRLEDGPYTEADVPDATDSYGESKAFGEVRGAPHLTVRCSFIGWGGGLLDWLAAPHDLPVPLWRRAYWSGSTAPAIARALVELAGRPEVTGLMHLTDGRFTSKGDVIMRLRAEGIVPKSPSVVVSEPYINRWLDTTRDDVPRLPPLAKALRELRR